MTVNVPAAAGGGLYVLFADEAERLAADLAIATAAARLGVATDAASVDAAQALRGLAERMEGR